MNKMFYQCLSLEEIPDISKWDVSNVTNMNSMFYQCSSLTILPNIFKWNFNNSIDLEKIFYQCTLIKINSNIINILNELNINEKNYFRIVIKCLSKEMRNKDDLKVISSYLLFMQEFMKID